MLSDHNDNLRMCPLEIPRELNLFSVFHLMNPDSISLSACRYTAVNHLRQVQNISAVSFDASACKSKLSKSISRPLCLVRNVSYML